jgi:hypothetical protein
MATMPLTVTVHLPEVRIKLTFAKGWRFRIWCTARIISIAGWVYGREIAVEYDAPEVKFNN